MNDEITIRWNNKILKGFNSATFGVSLDSIAGYFSFGIVDEAILPLQKISLPSHSERIEVYIGETSMLTAFVEKIAPVMVSEGRNITISGRSVTSDLIGSHLPAAMKRSGPVLNVANELLKPFPLIRVEGMPSSEKIDLNASVGAEYWDTLEKLGRRIGRLVWSTGDGVIRIGSSAPAKSRVTISRTNILPGAQAEFNISDIHSEYRVLSETPSTDGGWGSAVKQFITERGKLGRYKPHMIASEQPYTPAEAKARALWESRIRVSRAVTAQVKVKGYLIEANSPLKLNTLINVDYDYLGLNREMLVSGINYLYDDTLGKTMDLSLSLPGSYEPEPLIIKKSSDNLLQRLGWS